MLIGKIETDNRLLIVAEIGNNHEGDISRAREMIAAAAEAGVDAVKFQTIVPERLISSTDPARIEQLKRFQFSYDQFAGLAVEASRRGVMFLSTPFDLESVDFLSTIVPAFKIASSDNNFYPLIRRIALTGKPVILSSGLANMEELCKACDLVRSVWSSGKLSPGLAVLHCVSSYPTEDQDANLKAIAVIAGMNVTPGYSDHTIGIEACIAAVALGARILEKHFTLDKDLSDFRDHKLSADPKEISELVRAVRRVDRLLGSGDMSGSLLNKDMLARLRRSAAAGRDLPCGTVISKEDILWVRPGIGFGPGQEGALLGKKLMRALKMGEIVMPKDVQT